MPLHNVFDRIERISTDELTMTMPVLEKVVSPVAHVDVEPVEVGRSHQTSREVLENPTVTAVTNSLLYSVKHNHVSPRELVESPNGSIECATHSSPLGHEDIRPGGVEQTNQTSREELEIPTIDDISEPLQDGVEHDRVSPQEVIFLQDHSLLSMLTCMRCRLISKTITIFLSLILQLLHFRILMGRWMV